MWADSMTERESDGTDAAGGEPAKKPLSPAAERALREAEERRAQYRAQEAALPKELAGRGGNDPNRYGDWEIKGITADF